jgi:hypothetical protein
MSLLDHLRKQRVVAVAVALWVPAVAFGIGILWNYSTTPGPPAAPPSEWPSHAGIGRVEGRSSLLMFVHPQCPCSRASLGELAILMAHAGGKLDAKVFFYLPAAEPDSWAVTDLWQSAAAIPGVQVFADRRSAVAQNFGVFTSGQTLLYGSNGRLAFKGGITAYRGHSGDNAGRLAITELLYGADSARDLPVTTPVFGCSLRGE